MKRRKWLAALALMVLLCAACGQAPGSGETPPEGQYRVYFLSQESGETGNSLSREVRPLPAGRGAVDGLMRLLLAGPESPELVSPFPRGTSMRSWRVEEGTATIDLSEAYGGLSGADLTLADGCIVLTLCQLQNVDQVYLTVEGRPRPFRDQVLSAGDFLLSNGSGGAEQVETGLWFLRNGQLVREERILELATGDQPAIAALQALLAGPEAGDLEPVCSEGSRLLDLRRRGGVYTVDLNAAWLEGEDPQRLWAIVETLAELDPEAGVTFRIEDQALEEYAGLELREPLRGREKK